MTLEMRVLQRVVDSLGSVRSAARRLQVPLSQFFMCLRGFEDTPRQVFLDAVDFLIERGHISGLEAIEARQPEITETQRRQANAKV
jgi:hypothetical protein